MSIIIHIMKDGPKEPEKLLAFFALSSGADQQVGNSIQILPYGWVETDKGKFLVDEQAIKSMMQAFEAKKNDTVIDYEHQTLKDVIAPAAAWIKKLEDRGKDGLWGEVEWTPKALEFVKNKEYRYLSPVVFARKTDGRAVILHSCGLTNTPAIDGMEPIANKETEAKIMDLLKMLAGLLGLPETATEDDVKKAIADLQAKVQQSGEVVANKEVLTLLELPETANLADTKGKIIALKNPSGYVKAEEFKALQDKLATQERDGLVEMALKSGKVAPAQKAWAEQYALKDAEGFKAFLKDAPAVVPVGPEIGGGDPAKKKELDEVQISINKALGISDEDFKKFGGN
jgi:phage I-like protein